MNSSPPVTHPSPVRVRTRRWLWLPALLPLLVLLCPRPAEAHPHIFFRVLLEMRVRADERLELTYRLEATDSTSTAMLCEGDEDGDGTMTVEEMGYLLELYGGYFERNRHFVRVSTGDERADVEVSGFAVEERPGEARKFDILYRAVAEVGRPVPGVQRILHVDLYDREGYAAFRQAAEDVTVTPADPRVEVKACKLLPNQAGVALFYEVRKKAPAPAAAPPRVPVVTVTEAAAPSLGARLTAFLSEGRDRIAGLVEDLSRDFRWDILAGLLGFALLYGVFHALGPGHGKALVAAFMMRGESRPWHAAVLSVVVTVSHTGSSILLVLLLRWVLTLFLSERLPKNTVESVIGVVSGAIVTIIGLVLLVQMWRGKEESEEREEALTTAQVARWGLAVGLVPCPASITFLVVSNAVGLLWVGLLLVLALAVGLSVVLLVIAIATVYARTGASRLVAGRSKWRERLHTGVTLAGNLLVAGLGAFLVWFYASTLL